MRAIIIDDKDAKALLDKLKLESFGKDFPGYGVAEHEAWHALPASLRSEMINRLHGKFHYVVYQWLREQGANVT